MEISYITFGWDNHVKALVVARIAQDTTNTQQPDKSGGAKPAVTMKRVHILIHFYSLYAIIKT
jgi:hypothetical protein